MAVKDGLPSTDFSRMNREYIKAVADNGGGAFFLTLTNGETGLTLDKTCTEINAAFAAGLSCVFIQKRDTEMNRYVLCKIKHSENPQDYPYEYVFNGFNKDQINFMIFIGNNANDHPVFD